MNSSSARVRDKADWIGSDWAKTKKTAQNMAGRKHHKKKKKREKKNGTKMGEKKRKGNKTRELVGVSDDTAVL